MTVFRLSLDKNLDGFLLLLFHTFYSSFTNSVCRPHSLRHVLFGKPAKPQLLVVLTIMVLAACLSVLVSMDTQAPLCFLRRISSVFAIYPASSSYPSASASIYFTVLIGIRQRPSARLECASGTVYDRDDYEDRA